VYRTILGSRIRSQLAYRTSFWLNVVTSVAVGVVEFIELYAILANVPVFGGLNLPQAALVFALAGMGFALAEVVFGQLDTMPTYLRLGRLEVMLVRPMPLMLQLITSDFQLRRLGRVAINVVIMFIVLPTLHLDYTPGTIYLLLITPFVGAAIYAAFFATAGGLQFFLINGAEFTSAFVYGGAYAGQLPGSSQLWWDLPLRDSFRILAAIHRMSTVDAATRIEELVERLGLGHLLDVPVRQLSLGERMRGEVAAALVHRPRLLVLDEPTIGLDMISKERLRHFLLAERAECGTTLLLTTHDMGDIERLCERVLVVDQGHLVFDGTLSSLAAWVALQRVLVVDLPEPGPDIYVATATHIGSELDGQRQRLAFSPQQTTAARVLAEVSAVAEVIDLTLEEPAIEDIVRTLYGVP
jgi:ABC-type uncharacterized transport system ATPase subunit/ABC-type uncharacterized transport system permease subunit